jgi:hypothetical protein
MLLASRMLVWIIGRSVASMFLLPLWLQCWTSMLGAWTFRSLPLCCSLRYLVVVVVAWGIDDVWLLRAMLAWYFCSSCDAARSIVLPSHWSRLLALMLLASWLCRSLGCSSSFVASSILVGGRLLDNWMFAHLDARSDTFSTRFDAACSYAR